jgi:cellulose synthase/poly-beta-1,6-N-acetylglucosamine synthase-like glycosyltransferase
LISIIIPNLHSPIIDKVIGALQNQTIAVGEIIVVGQDCYDLIPPSVRFVVTPQPVSVTRARNLGLSVAQGEYVMFVDADCIATPHCIEHILARHAEGWAAVGASMALEARPYWTLCDNILTFTQSLSIAIAGTRTYIPGFAMSFRRSAIAEIEGFDETFTGAGGGDDLEFCWRLMRRGYQLFFEPAAIFFHRPQRTSFASIWRHLHHFGRTYAQVVQRYPDVLPSRISSQMAPLSGLLIALAPLLALLDTLQLYRALPGLRCYWSALPGLVCGKIAWYWGAVESMILSSRRAVDLEATDAQSS